MLGAIRIGCFLILACLPAYGFAIEDGVLVLFVTNTADEPVSNITITCGGDCAEVNALRGKVRLKLPPQTRAGDWLTLRIVKRSAHPDWVFLSPWDGRVLVPSFDNKADNAVAVVVARRGDKQILVSGKALETITARVLKEVAPKLDRQISDEERKLVLQQQATALGLTTEEVDRAIREWGSKTKDPYERGLVKLYEKNYSEAELLLKEAQKNREQDLQNRERDLRNRKQDLQKAKAKVIDVALSLGQTYYWQGKFNEAVKEFRKAAELGNDTFLVLIWFGSSLFATDENIESEQIFKRALINSEQLFGVSSPAAISILSSLTLLCAFQGKYAEAKTYSDKASSIAGKFSKEENVFVILNKVAAAKLSELQGRHAEAESLYKDIIAITDKLDGKGGIFAAPFGQLGLAKLYESQEKYIEAENLYQQALAIIVVVFGPDHIFVANTLESLGSAYEGQKRFEKAAIYYKRSVAIEEKVLGSEHLTLSISLNNLAIFLHEREKYAEAEPLYKRALEIREKALGKDHLDTAKVLNNLARLYRMQKRYEEAETFFLRAIEIREKALGKEHPDTLTSLSGLALLYKAQGRYNEAESIFKRILEIREKSPGKEHPDTASTLNNLADLYYAEGKYAEAEPIYQRALAIREKALGTEHPDTATVLENYATLLRKMNRDDEASKLEARAQQIREKLKAKNNQ